MNNIILKDFNSEMFALCADLEYGNRNKNEFQRQLSSKLREVTQKNCVVVGSDKTGNHYLMKPGDYMKVLLKNIPKEYREVDLDILVSVKTQAFNIVQRLNLWERMETHTEQTAFLRTTRMGLMTKT